jgi:hypothetical protein
MGEPGPLDNDFYSQESLILGDDHVRTLTLRHGRRGDSVVCNLETKCLPRRESMGHLPDPQYTTLSYEWGDTSNPVRITCNEGTFNVSQNLYAALIHLRDTSLDLILWIDAICINQRDNDEKSSQIQRMGQIYSRSSHTIVWLGKASYISRQGIRACKTFGEAMQLNVEQHSHRPALTDTVQISRTVPTRVESVLQTLGLGNYLLVWQCVTLIAVLRRSYFSRIWIVQEIVLSHSVEFACGADRIGLLEFIWGSMVILSMSWCGKREQNVAKIVIARSLLPWVEHQGLLGPQNRFTKLARMNNEILPERDILTLLSLFRQSNATVAVDRIFALVGLSMILQTKDSPAIELHYPADPFSRQSTREIFVQFARGVIKRQNSLRLFSAISYRPPPGRTELVYARFNRTMSSFLRWTIDNLWGRYASETLKTTERRSKLGCLITYLRSLFCINRVSTFIELDLPSWVPNWTDKENIPSPIISQANTKDLPFDNNMVIRSVIACPLDADLRIRLISNSESPDPNILIVEGYFLSRGGAVDRIEREGNICNTKKAHRSLWFRVKGLTGLWQSHRLESLDRWAKQFYVNDSMFWDDFIATATCGFRSNDYDRCIERALTDFRSHHILQLNWMLKCVYVFLCLRIVQAVLWPRPGLWWWVVLNWVAVFLTLVVAVNLSYRAFPNFYELDELQKSEFRKMVSLTSGRLALVPALSRRGDVVAICRRGVVPLVLRPLEADLPDHLLASSFVVVGECYVHGEMHIGQVKRSRCHPICLV